MITPLEAGFRYKNPDSDIAYIEVTPVNPHNPQDYPRSVEGTAHIFQAVMNEAWTEQLKERFQPEDITKTVSPENTALVRAQTDRLRSGNQPDAPAYVLAHYPSRTHMFYDGIGKALEVKRLLRPNLADISNVFVSPRSQSKGMGSAITRTLLDAFPVDMQTAVYDFPFNRRTVALLGRIGFSAKKTWQKTYFGQKVDQTWFEGPEVGELIETMETKRPWLRERQPRPINW